MEKKKIGLEATGHYGQNLKLLLAPDGFTFMEFNPLLISRFVHSKSLRNTKTDSIDSQSIARYVMTVVQALSAVILPPGQTKVTYKVSGPPAQPPAGGAY